MTSTDPTGGADAWKVAHLNGAYLNAISCPLVSECVGVGVSSTGQPVVATSTDPTGGADVWNIASLGQTYVRAISCPSASLCVAVGPGGVITSADPTGGADAWKPTHLPGANLDLTWVSCASVSLCVAVSNADGSVVASSSDPTGGASAWNLAPSPVGLGALACPSAALCVSVRGPVVVVSTEPAAVPSPSPWHLTSVDGTSAIDAISCPSASLCVAVDNAAHVLSSINPAVPESTWNVTYLSTLEDERFSSSMSCVSQSLCVEFGTEVGCGVACSSAGQVISSTDPTGGESAWRTTFDVGAPIELSGPGAILAGGTCPSPSLCVAVDSAGNVITSTDPEGGTSSWRSSPVDVGRSLSAISCASPDLCVALDSGGNVVTSTKPTAGPHAWKTSHVDSHRLNAISCPTPNLCVAVDDGGNVLSATKPTGGPRAWRLVHLDGGSVLTRVSCPSVLLCVALSQSGNVVSSTSPTGNPAAWTVAPADPTSSLTAVSCPSTALCVAGDEQGNVLLGTTTGVSPTAAIAALQGALGHSCSEQRVARALKQHGCATPFIAPGPGVITISWLGPHRTKIAFGETDASGARRVTVHVRLTRSGIHVLNNAHRTTQIQVTAAFKDLPGHLYTKTASIKLVASKLGAGSHR